MSEEDVVVNDPAGENPDVVATPPQADPELEREALDMGWIPKEQFRGDPSQWRPAEEFVKRGREFMPILKARDRKNREEISQLKNELQSTRTTLEKIVKVSEKVSQQAYEKAKAELTQQQATAVAAGDTATWMRLEQDKEKLEKPEPVQMENPQAPPVHPEFRAWQEENPWYKPDDPEDELTIYANAVGARLAQSLPKGTPYHMWASQVAEKTRKAFPHRFQNPNRSRASAVDGGDVRQPGPGRPKAKTYNDLPADAKEVCDKYVKQGLHKDRESYVKIYFEED
jgi:hypothetical protein